MGNDQGILFSLGQVFVTPGATGALNETEQTAEEFLGRHMVGDWGEVSEEDRRANDLGVTDGKRIASSYYTSNGTKIWVITEYDRSRTSLFLPLEY